MWDALPAELVHHIASFKLARMCGTLDVSAAATREAFYRTRLVCRAFASALRATVLLLCPMTNPDHPSLLVEGVLQLVWDMFHPSARSPRLPSTLSFLYGIVYRGSTQSINHSEGYYSALGTTLTALLKDGTLRRTQGAERAKQVRFIAQVFAYLDRFYVERLQLAPLKQHLAQAFANAEGGV